MSEYSEKLKDPQWQRKRLEILNRDDFTCRFCEAKNKTLHVHHLFYVKGRAPWDYPPGSLMTLCEECHGYEHDFAWIAGQDLLQALRSLGAASWVLGSLHTAVTCPLNLANTFLVQQIGAEEWRAIGDVLAATLRHIHTGGDVRALADDVCAKVAPMPEVKTNLP